jgi:hypothetical protein
MKRTQSSISGFTSALRGVGAALAVGTIVAWGKGIADAADQMAKLARRTDSTIMGLESVRLAAGYTGIAFGKLQSSMARLQKTIGEELMGGGKTVLADIGIDAAKLAGMDVDGKFIAISESLDKFGNKAQKAAALSRIFGRSGAEMVDVFDKGGAAIKGASDYLAEMGINMDSAEIEAMNDRFLEAQTSMRLFGTMIVNEVAPAFQDWAVGIGVVVKALAGLNSAVDENGEKLSGWDVLYKKAAGIGEGFMKAIRGGTPTTKEGWEDLEGGGLIGAGRRALAEGNVDEQIDEQYTANLQKLSKALEDGRISHDQYKESVAAAYEEKKRMLEIEQPTSADLSTSIVVPEWTAEQKEAMAAAEAAAKQLEAEENAIVASLSGIGDAIREKMITPIQEYEQQTAQLSEALERGIINEEEFAFAMNAANEALQKSDPAFAAATSAMEKYADQTQTIKGEMAGLQEMFSQGLIDEGTLTRGLDELQNSLNELDPAFVAARDNFEELKGAAASLYEETRTPMEKTMEEMAKLHEMAAAGLIDQDTFNRGFAKIQSEFDEQMGGDAGAGAGMGMEAAEKRSVFAGEATGGAAGMAGLMAASAIGGANSIESQQLSELKMIREALQRGTGMGGMIGVWA